jgi:hypothetical protein
MTAELRARLAARQAELISALYGGRQPKASTHGWSH